MVINKYNGSNTFKTIINKNDELGKENNKTRYEFAKYVLERKIKILFVNDEKMNNILYKKPKITGLITNKSKLDDYNFSTIDSYIYYFILQCILSFIDIILWSTYPTTTHLILLFFSIPTISTVVYKNYYFILLCSYVKHKVQIILKYILSKSLANIINLVCDVCLNCKPNYDYREISNYYDKCERSMFIDFISIFFKLLTINYLKKTNNILANKIMKLIHKYEVTQIYEDKIKKKEKLSIIISSRQWNELLDPSIINILFELYEEKGDDTLIEKINEKISKIKYYIIKFSTLIVFGEISVILPIIINWALNVRKNVTKREMIAYIVSIPFFLIQSLFMRYIAATISIFGGYLVPNTIEYLKENDFSQYYSYDSKNNYIFLALFPLVIELWSIPLVILVEIFLGFNLLAMIITTITTVLLWTSNYNPLHCFVLMIFIYIFTNALKYFQKPEIDEKIVDILYNSNYFKTTNEETPKPLKKDNNNKSYIDINKLIIRDDYF